MKRNIQLKFVRLTFVALLVFVGLLTVYKHYALMPARKNRAAFCHAMAKIENGWSPAKVRYLLGPPDDIWPKNDSDYYVVFGDEVWCYGTNGHHTLPTLGYITFRNDKVSDIIGGRGKPPSPKVISEAELIEAMRQMYRPRDKEYWSGADTQRLIQVSNLLISKGQKKALAILEEYIRIEYDGILGDGVLKDDTSEFGTQGYRDSYDDMADDTWLYWLVRVAFTSNQKSGVFPVPENYTFPPWPPDDLRKWPSFPVAIVDDVPSCLYRGLGLRDISDPFNEYFYKHKKEWTIKRKQLRPPDDPFPAYKKLINSSIWQYAQFDPSIRLRDEGYALREILTLVRSAYRPRDTEVRNEDINALDYDRYHKEFLALGCRWDTARQMYVRKDGTVLSDPVYDFPQYQHRFHSIPMLDISVVFSRKNDRMGICNVIWGGKGTKTIPNEIWGTQTAPNAIITVEDPDSGRERGRMSFDEPQNSENISDSNATSISSTTTKIKIVLEDAPDKPDQLGGESSTFFDLVKGKRVRFAILFAGKRYISPVYIL